MSAERVAEIRQRLKDDGLNDAQNYEDLLWCLGELERNTPCAVRKAEIMTERAEPRENPQWTPEQIAAAMNDGRVHGPGCPCGTCTALNRPPEPTK